MFINGIITIKFISIANHIIIQLVEVSIMRVDESIVMIIIKVLGA